MLKMLFLIQKAKKSKIGLQKEENFHNLIPTL